MTIEDKIEVEEIDFINAVYKEIQDYVMAITDCNNVLTQLQLYQNMGYKITYKCDTKTNEFTFEAYKPKIGYK